MASHEKKRRLCECDLALAATMADEEELRRFILRFLTGRPYPFYRSAKSLIPSILSIMSLVLIPSEATLKKAIARKCKKGRVGEVPGNQKIVAALREYAIAHKVTGVEFQHDKVPLGKAGLRQFWSPFIIEIDGKKYIPYFDPRLDWQLSPEARRFVFSVNHTYIRAADPALFSDVGFAIFQFKKKADGSREIIVHFDDGVELWTDKEIGKMVDALFRMIEAVEAERATPDEKKKAG
ncbi:MAG TPA: hypothetical protein VGM17_15290 [Rhizomicrobium sp.]|jgi:hypothetical protein